MEIELEVVLAELFAALVLMHKLPTHATLAAHGVLIIAHSGLENLVANSQHSGSTTCGRLGTRSVRRAAAMFKSRCGKLTPSARHVPGMSVFRTCGFWMASRKHQ